MNLTVISEVRVDCDRIETVNRSLNEILRSYSRHFDSIHYIGPGYKDISMKTGIGENIYLSSISHYAKSLKKRIRYFVKWNEVQWKFKQLLEMSSTDIVQLRIPSLFSMAVYPVLKRMEIPITTYIAGDWSNSFQLNYKFIGSSIIGNTLDFLQRPIIKNSIPVTAGPVLAKKYAQINNCHAYYSTTHREIVPKVISQIPSKILYVGRLEALKRIEDAIEAIRILKTRGINISLSIIGRGIMRSTLEKMIFELGLQDRIFLKGQIDDPDELKHEFLNADLFILPSLSEGTPKVIAEAMAHGTVPIAVNSTGSNKYIIFPGINGFLVPPKSPLSIANIIERLFNQEDNLSKLAKGAYQYATSHTLDEEVNKLWAYVKMRLDK